VNPKVGSIRAKTLRRARPGEAWLVSTPSPSPRTPLRCVGPLTPPRSAPVCPWWSTSGALRETRETGQECGGNAQGPRSRAGNGQACFESPRRSAPGPFRTFGDAAAWPVQGSGNRGRLFRAQQRGAAPALPGGILGATRGEIRPNRAQEEGRGGVWGCGCGCQRGAVHHSRGSARALCLNNFLTEMSLQLKAGPLLALPSSLAPPAPRASLWVLVGISCVFSKSGRSRPW
jgi:hypothetical protein